MANKYRYPLSNGKFLTLEGDTEPSTREVENIARESGLSLKGLETPSARRFSTGTSDRTAIDAAQDFLSRNPVTPSVNTGPSALQQDDEESSDGLLSGIYHAATTPLTHYISTEGSDKFSDWMTTPTLHDNQATAMLKGLIGGTVSGLGHVKNAGDEFSNWMSTPTKDDSVTSATLKGLVGGTGKGLLDFGNTLLSPSGIIQMLTGSRIPIPGVNPGTMQTLGKVAAIPGMIHGGYKTIAPSSTLAERGQGLAELGMNFLGYKGASATGRGIDTAPRGETVPPDFDLPLREAPPKQPDLTIRRHPQGTPYDLPIRPESTGFDLPLNEPTNRSGGLQYPLPPEGPVPTDLPIGPRDEGPLLDLPLNRPNAPSGNELPLQTDVPPAMDLPLRQGINPQVAEPIASWQSPDFQIGRRPSISFNEPTPSPINEPVNTGTQAERTTDPYETLGNYLKQQRLAALMEKSKNGTLTAEELAEGNKLLGVSDETTPVQPDLPIERPNAWGLTEPPTGTSPNLSQGGLPFDRSFAPELGPIAEPEPTVPELTPEQKQTRLDEIIDKAQKGPLSLDEFREGNQLHQELSSQPTTPESPDKMESTLPPEDKSPADTQTLPKGKLRYNTGKKSYTLDFADDVDKSLLALSQSKPGKNDAAHLKYAMEQTGLDEAGVREAGKKVRAAVKEQLKNNPEGVVKIESIHNATTKESSLFNPKQSEGNPYIQNPNDLNSYASANKLRNTLEGMAASMPDHPDHALWVKAHDMADEAVTEFENITPNRPTRKATGDEAASQIPDRPVREATGDEALSQTDNDTIAESLKMQSELQDVKTTPPSGQERATPSMAASLPVGAKLNVNSKTFSPAVWKKLHEMGFDYDGVTELGNHRFIKATDQPRTAPILESDIGSARPMGEPTREKQTAIGEITNFSRSMMASLDMSAPLRQGIGLAHRKEFWQALPDMVKSWGSQAVYDGVMADINSRPIFMKRQGVGGTELPSFAQDVGLKLTNMYDLASREESFMSNLAGKIPGVKRSERAYSAFLNKLRADTFEALIKDGKVFGADGEINVAMARELANFVNTATGRGSLGSLEKSASALNNTFFAPRLIASRLQMLNPMTYVNAAPQVRKEYLKSLFTIASAGMGIGQLAKMAGAKVETDPTSSDYGKIRIGDTRIDPYAGFQQYIVNAKRLMPSWASIGKPTNTGILPLDLASGLLGTPGGYTKSTTTQNKYELGAKYGRSTRLDVAERFVEGKLNPVWSFATGMLKGKTFTGQPFNIPEEVAARVVPLIVQDVKELATEDPNLIPGIHKKNPYKEFHPENLPMAAPAFFGAGVQPYSSFRHN
jgi:hypothetical protein